MQAEAWVELVHSHQLLAHEGTPAHVVVGLWITAFIFFDVHFFDQVL
jgi:hypothetical protein